MTPEITIGLTFYNNANTLRDALKSIFAQTFQDWELIIIDDYSTDGSFEMATSISDSRVKVYREEKRFGFVNALNRMTELAQGRYYARMDADDMMHPERLSRQLQYLKANKDLDLVDTAMYSMDQEGNPVGIREAASFGSNREALLRGKYFHHATIMGCTEWFNKNRYDPLFVRAEDCELWCRTFSTSRFARINEPLYFVREGLVNIRNYLDSSHTVRRIVRKYGPEMVGRYRTMQLLGESFLKGFAYWTLGSINIHDFLVNKRNRRLDPGERELAKSIIERILSCNVSGL